MSGDNVAYNGHSETGVSKNLLGEINDQSSATLTLTL